MVNISNLLKKTNGVWPLTRILLLLLAGGFFTLMLDIREEHVDVVKHHIMGWIPIGYSALMTAACLVVLFNWKSSARAVLFWLFALGIVVGFVGFGFHNHWNFLHVVQRAIAVWYNFKLKHGDHPPSLAPLSFVGLGIIGMLICAKRFNPDGNAK